GQWCDHGAIVRILPGETKEFDVVTNETQGALNGHVRGVYIKGAATWLEDTGLARLVRFQYILNLLLCT
ncbi:MAG: hypothetical protein LBP35_02660, partial [Candidatus Ancillula trichonymphae]|nr:hypothetical protein [Candidatus Ancillula trichonymphae]